eukprot:jgi/Undpi1/2928/HiC_scaffold_14.g06305.m1
MAQPSRTAVLGLYKGLRRQGSRLMDYNYRDYALRRARKGFEMARGFAPEEAEVAFAKGQQQLDLVRRQATISQLYPHQFSGKKRFLAAILANICLGNCQAGLGLDAA